MMEHTYDTCPNCKAPVKKGLLGANEIVAGEITKFIKTFTNSHADAFCSKCVNNTKLEAQAEWKKLSERLHTELKETIAHIPVITLQNPLDWDYTVIAMATGQTVTGTGVLTEFAASFTDLFGMQSDKYNAKIKHGEDLCKAQLRLAAVNMGANAVIATDIDYAEVGGDKGMLMVCMSGTAVKLHNPEILGDGYRERFIRISYINDQLAFLSKYTAMLHN